MFIGLKGKGHQRIASLMSLRFSVIFLLPKIKNLMPNCKSYQHFVVENGITIWLYSETQLAMKIDCVLVTKIKKNEAGNTLDGSPLFS